MDAAKAQVLFDVALLTLGALAVGLPLFALLRNRDPQIGWHHHGNVWSAPFDRIDLVVAGFLVLYFLAQAAAPFLMAEQLAAAEKAAEGGDGGPSITALIAISTVFNLALGAGVFSYASTLRGRDPMQMFGLSRLRPVAVMTWVAGGIVVAFVAVYIGASVWIVFFKDAWGSGEDLQEVVTQLAEATDPLLKGLILVSAVVVAPLVEEVIFRGFLYAVLKRFSDRFFAAALSSLLFAAVHGNVPGLLPLFLLALVLALAYELSGCLWVPVGIHAAFNALQSALILYGPAPGAG